MLVVVPQRDRWWMRTFVSRRWAGGERQGLAGGCVRVRLFSRNGTVFGRSPQSRWHSGK